MASARWSRLAPIAAVAAMALAVVPAAFGSAALASRAGTPGHGTVTTASSAIAASHLAPTLQARSAKGGSSLVSVFVVEAKDSGRPHAMTLALQVHLKADPAHEFWAGTVRADRLVKLAGSPGVAYVADDGRRVPPPAPDVTAPTFAQRLAAGHKGVALMRAATKAGTSRALEDGIGADSVTPPAAGQPTDWFEVGPVHKSSLAWANGFTGAGVKVAVADDGLDFGHPDLQGTEAYVTDRTSPYYGWPMAFDPFSTFVYATDKATGSDFVQQGGSWFSSTTATVTATRRTFDGVTYKLPHTSKSGVYHIGHLWDQNLATYWYQGEYPALLVADEHTKGVYDTVYVDLDDNHDFTNDKRLTKASPISTLDFAKADGTPGADGIADLSGGMLYWISDGKHQPPLFDQEFGLGPVDGVFPPHDGDLVCMMGAYDLDSDHGTLCASDVAGQGRIDGESIAGEFPPFKGSQPGTRTGVVEGGGRDAKLVAISDVYNNYSLSTLMAYDYAAFGPDGQENTGDEVQVVSNSYGESSTDNDEWDYPSRYITDLNTEFAPTTTFLFATGNGGPGYGTSVPPAPSTGIKVGASTMFGADGGWDSIDTSAQVTFGDVIPFSDRGPTAMGHASPTVVADGAFAAGSEALSLAGGNGWTAWEIWGGTSRSTPVASGNLALVEQAFRGAHGRWPTWSEAAALLSSGATDLGYDTLTQGAGMVNADRSTRLAAGLPGAGVKVTPNAWYPGSFEGLSAPAFAQIVHPGDTATGTVTVTNPSAGAVGVTVNDSWLQRDRTTVVTLTIDPSHMSPYDFNRPDVLVNVTGLAHPGDQLMVVRAVMPSSEFDTNGDYTSDNRLRLLTYDWTDRNGNGRLWTDSDGNGVVNAGELDPGEYMRFTYSNANGPFLENEVQDPAGRSHDGLFVGIQQQVRAGAPVHVTLEISFWRRADMPWLSSSIGALTLAPGESRSVGLTCAVPAGAPLGTYEGEYRFSAAGTTTVVPVVITVAGKSANVSYGGATPYEQLMDGGKVFGCQDWDWRAESGDWRFIDTDVPASQVGTGSVWLAHTSWETTPTDIDTLLYGPQGGFDPASTFGPYDLAQTGGSPNTNTGAGVWTFDTATGRADDWVSGPLQSGLNEIMLHDVQYSGASVGETFTGAAGVLDVNPTTVSYDDTATTHTQAFTFKSSIDLPGFGAVGFGMSRVLTLKASVAQGAYYSHEFDVQHAAYIQAQTRNDDSDIDLYLERWNGSAWLPVAASETASGDEYIQVAAPADGHYRVRVYGYAVSAARAAFDLVLTVPQGEGITVGGLPSGPVSAGTTMTLTASFSPDRTTLDERDGALVGVIEAGPAGATRALQIPVELSYPLFVEETSPAAGASDVGSITVVSARFSRRVDPTTLTNQTFYLLTGAHQAVRGTVTYDDGTATAYLHVPVSPDTTYTAVLTPDVTTADFEEFDGYVWRFATRKVGPTLTTFTIPASTVRYGSATPFTAHAYASGALVVPTAVGASLVASPDAGAPLELQFRASGSSTWTKAGAGTADAAGVWRGHITGSRPGSYRIVRLLSWTGQESASAADALAVTFAPSITASVRTARRGHALKVLITVKPGGSSSRRYVHVQRRQNGRWVTYRSVRLSSAGKATYWASRTTRGSRTIRVVLTAGKGYRTGASSALTLRWR